MAKFLILFIGGSVSEDKKQQSIIDRLAWNSLGAEGTFIDGSPLKPEGIMIHTNTEARYAHDDESVNGYAIIDVDDIDTAIDVAQSAPQVKSEYGSATAEIRPLLSLI